MKNIEDSFRDWESNTFGFGYGIGEKHTVPALRRFLELCNEGPYNGSYDYRKLEAVLGCTTAWLFINILCKYNVDMIEYGTSPRCGWLTSKGKRLKEFMLSHPAEELVGFVTYRTKDSNFCYPNACNCGPKGYQEGVHCANPFWDK